MTHEGDNTEVTYVDHDKENLQATIAARSPSSDLSDAATETNYALLLSRVPGFEGYANQGSESKNGTLNTHRSQVAAGTPRIDDVLPQRSVSFKAPRIHRGSLSSHGPQPVLLQLKRISRKRDFLMQLQSQIKALSREIASLRADLAENVKHGDSLAGIVDSAIEHTPRNFEQYQESLHVLLDEIATVEGKLEPLQDELTNVQYDVKVSEDRLYASLTGGEHPADSEAGVEDDMLMSILNNDDNTDVVDVNLIPGPLQAQAMPGADFRDMDEVKASATGFAFDSATDVNLVRKRNGSRSRHQSPATKSRPRKKSADINGVMTSGGPALINIVQDADTTTDLIAHFGSWVPDSGTLRPRTLAASQSSYLIAAKELRSIRRNDFRAILGFDIDRLDHDLLLMNGLKPSEMSSVAQKLAHINVETIHTRQFISLWGREMSQNSPLELSRTQLYGRQDVLDILKRQSQTAVLLRLVADVRKLEVPSNSANAIDNPEIKVGEALTDYGPESSIMVQLSDYNSSYGQAGSKRS